MLINQSINLFEDYHGYQGPIKVTDAEEIPKITEALLKAVQDKFPWISWFHGIDALI